MKMLFASNAIDASLPLSPPRVDLPVDKATDGPSVSADRSAKSEETSRTRWVSRKFMK